MERSTLAWFRAVDPDLSNPLDDTALLIDALRRTHDIDVVTSARAHDFVWQHFRRPYDLCAYELRDGRAHEFMHPYLVHYPGVVLLRGKPRRLRRLMARARLVVTPHSVAVETLQDEYPGSVVRFAPAGMAAHDVTEDVVVALQWPPDGEAPTRALAGMAAGAPVIVFEGEASADWPALNPQTWQSRSAGPSASAKASADRRSAKREGWLGPADPIVISIDPRDEHHSLKLAVQRLSADPALRASLGAAARDWWKAHATVDHAVSAWESIIAEARTLAPPPLPEWLTLEDGTARAREILAEFEATMDLF